jgi:TolB protein
MSAEGGEASLVTPYTFGNRAFFTSPDWSPTGDMIAFHGESLHGYQIMIADVSRPGSARQITDSGNNEDPSWAPDGRHIVYAGVGRGGSGLYVIDTQSGRIRTLVSGARIQMPEWSGSLAPAAVARAGN